MTDPLTEAAGTRAAAAEPGDARGAPGRAPAPEHAEAGSVYWMEASKRRQALEWLKRADLAAGERDELAAFVRGYRTDPLLARDDRRRLLSAFDRIHRRLRSCGPSSPNTPPGPEVRPPA
jgi:hypothetical protein